MSIESKIHANTVALNSINASLDMDIKSYRMVFESFPAVPSDVMMSIPTGWTPLQMSDEISFTNDAERRRVALADGLRVSERYLKQYGTIRDMASKSL